MLEPGQELEITEKVSIISSEPNQTSFCISNEDHTLANVLRHIAAKNPNVTFCAYSIPHPTEPRVNFRIQTNGIETPLQVLKKALNDVIEVCTHVHETFEESLKRYNDDILEQ